MRRSSVVACAGTVLLAAFFSGGCSCSSTPQRQPVYGKIVSAREVKIVTLQPNPELVAPAVTTSVVDGTYQFSREDGPIPGGYRAVFTFADSVGTFGAGSSSKKEFLRPTTPTPQAPPTPPPAEVPIIVPADGSLEINITLP